MSASCNSIIILTVDARQTLNKDITLTEDGTISVQFRGIFFPRITWRTAKHKENTINNFNATYKKEIRN